MRRLHSILICILLSLPLPQLFSQQTTDRLDSTFQVLSLPELQSYRRYYIQELQSLQNEKSELIQKGIEDGERLLSVNPNSEMVDEIFIRLADLYYYQSKDDYLTRMEIHDEALTLSEQTGEPVTEPEPKLDCMKSLLLYQRIIDELPQSDLVDDAVYNKAFLYEEMGENQIANDIYQYLIDAYPNSPYIPEAYMRLGEYYFNPPVNDLDKAIEYYTKISAYKSNPRYSESLYKLGWTYYRLSDYTKAISYFTSLVEDVSLSKKYDPESASSRADLMDEALEYIAISFHDYGGSAKAVEYLRGIGSPDWSSDVLNKLGDVYMEQKEEYTNAITAFRYFLDFVPFAADAPVIMRKIVDCYLLMDEYQDAFTERHKLFLTYRKGSLWWNRMEDQGKQLAAYRLTEQALRENINMLIEQADTATDQSIYDEVVALGRIYLENFPEDLYAYMIRWNIALILDTRLFQFKDALQEYLTICLVYNTSKYENFARNKGLSTIRDAAANAIVVSDSIVARSRRNPETRTDLDAIFASDEPVPLTTAESWQAMAYDNYIKLYPFDQENTPLILANAGALYYIHNQFTEALKYFNTLVQYFPESDKIETVKLSILDSYFGKKDYKSAELLAKRILATQPGKEVEKRVRTRLGEAIFLNAQGLASQPDKSLAAKEFHRMALEVPTMEFADRALFNAALHYEQVNDLPSAIGVYEKLCTVYSTSPLFNDALNNTAINYAELGDSRKAAQYYSALAARLDDSQKKRDALYNAFVYSEQAGDYQAAITSGQKYAEMYSDSADAAGVYYKTALCYIKLDNKPAAIKALKTFTEKFPTSPVAVEVSYRLGQYYEEQNDQAAAEETYNRAHDIGVNFINSGVDVDGHFVAEALYQATKLMHVRFNRIELRLPQSNFDLALRRKQQMLSELTERYTQIAAYKTTRLPEAVYCLGRVFEDFGKTWAAQEVPGNLNETELVVKEKSINEQTNVIYRRAVNGYINAIGAISQVQNQLVTTPSDSAQSGSPQTSAGTANPQEWRSNAESKISELLYTIAEINRNSLDRFLTTPVPADLDNVAKLEYRNQLLFKIAQPLTVEIAESHLRNIHVSDSLGIDNNWRRNSQEKIIDYSLLLFREYRQLSFDALGSLEEVSLLYKKQALEKQQTPPEEWAAAMINLTELYKTYGRAAVHFYHEGVKKINSYNIQDSGLAPVYEDLVNFALTSADTIDKLLVIEESLRAQSDALFLRDDKLLFEEALTVFEDNIYFLEECRKIILETALAKYSELPDRGEYSNAIVVRLLEIDPSRLVEFGSYIRELRIVTDTDWIFHEGLREGGTSALSSPQGWERPIRTDAGLVWGRQSAETGQTSVTDTLLIRKYITVPGQMVTGNIQIQNVKPEYVVINGVLAASAGEGEYPIPPASVKQGRNDIIIMCKRGVNFAFQAEIKIKYIPLITTSKTER